MRSRREGCCYFTESSLVANIVDTLVGLRVFAVNSSDLDVVLISQFLEPDLILGEVRKFNVDARSETSTEVRRAARIRVGGFLIINSF